MSTRDETTGLPSATGRGPCQSTAISAWAPSSEGVIRTRSGSPRSSRQWKASGRPLGSRVAAAEAALDRLDELEAEEHDDVEDHAINTIRTQLDARLARYRRRLDLLETAEAGEIPMSPQYEAAVRLRRAVIDAQREELLNWRDIGRLPDESLRALERELDHEEGLLPQRES